VSEQKPSQPAAGKHRRRRAKRSGRKSIRESQKSKGSTSTIPEPMMWDVARAFQNACLADDSGVSDHLFKSSH
jgi:hypothetical protein